MKKCSKCELIKELTEFYKSKKYSDGYRCSCKLCMKEYNIKNKEKISETKRKYRSDKKEELKIKAKNRYEKNKKERLKQMKQYRKINSESIKNNLKLYRTNNKEIIAEKMKQYNFENKDRLRIKHKEYYDNNRDIIIKKRVDYERNKIKSSPEFKILKNVRRLFTISLNSKYIDKKQPFFKYTEINYSEYIDHFKNNYPLEFSEFIVTDKYHIDHIIPCSAYDFNNIDHIKLCWNPKNLRLITAEENLKKNNKLDFDLIKKHNIGHLLP